MRKTEKAKRRRKANHDAQKEVKRILGRCKESALQLVIAEQAEMSKIRKSSEGYADLLEEIRKEILFRNFGYTPHKEKLYRTNPSRLMDKTFFSGATWEKESNSLYVKAQKRLRLSHNEVEHLFDLFEMVIAERRDRIALLKRVFT